MKSQFEQFIQEALKSHEKVEIQRSSNEYLNYQTEKAIQNSKKGLKIASSFIKMGIAATIIAVPALAAAGGNDLTTSKYQDEMRQVVKVSQEKGYLTAKMNIDIKENKYTGERYGAENHGINQADVMSKASCDVTITLSKTGDRAYMAHDDDIKELTAPKNEMQKKLSREFMLLHEASHCQLETMKDVFLIKGNPQLQKDVNYYFKHAYGTESSDSPYFMLNENFADTYAAIQLLKLYGDTPDVKAVLHATSLEREDQDLSNGATKKLDSHYTHFSLQEVLTKDNLNKIKSTSDPAELRQIALEIANKGTFTVFSTYAEVLPALFEQNSMIDSTLINAVHNSVSALLESSTSKFKLSFNKPSEDVSFFKQLGQETANKAQLKRTYNSNKEVADLSLPEQTKLRETSRNVFHERYGDEFEKIDAVSEQFKKYIVNNHKPVLEQKTAIKTTLEQLEEKRVVMLKNYELRGKEIENSGNFMDKANVLKNIQSLRPDTSKTSTFNPS